MLPVWAVVGAVVGGLELQQVPVVEADLVKSYSENQYPLSGEPWSPL
jgi:hypothetical protein